MGEQEVSILRGNKKMNSFIHSLLKDVKALEFMLENDWFEDDIVRIGAEQEMCLVDTVHYKPACIGMEVIEELGTPDWLETELAKFNLELNLIPRVFEKNCFSALENEIEGHLKTVKQCLNKRDADVILTGILPTLRKDDLDMKNLTPKKRYKALMEAINSQLKSSHYELRLYGVDELHIKHDSPLLEACNTSFQVHLQVAPNDFVKLYNMAQVLAAPVMAIGSNSPLVFGKRLWHESRIALFQQSLDTRSVTDHMRESSPRVNFGNDWLNNSILDIYREDISRFRVLISGDVSEDSLTALKKGVTPHLRALQVHNSTVYRWNRPCYGISPNGKPHLRIESRVLAAGPTVADEVANAQFWLGAMVGMADEYDDIRKEMAFADAKDNFEKAARFGIDAVFTWFGDEKITVSDLIEKKLIPLARKGLTLRKVDKKDIDKYLGIIAARVKEHKTGARWLLRSFTELTKEISSNEALTTISAAMVKNQTNGRLLHEWPLPKVTDLKQYKPSMLTVEEFMETDLFTVKGLDPVSLVSEMMQWRGIRYTPVENEDGHLIGLITSRLLLRHYTSMELKGSKKDVCARDIMIGSPESVTPETTLIEAMKIMREKGYGSLPVVKSGELVGLISEKNFLDISSSLISRMHE